MDYEQEEVGFERFDMWEGWGVFVASDPPPKPDQLPLYLSKAVAAWQKQTPSLTVRATLRIVATGNTIAVHVRFDA